MIENALVAYLQAYAGLSALGFRLYPDKAPPDAASPFGILRQVSGGGRVRTMGGPTGLSYPIWEIEVHADTSGLRNNAAKQLRLALDGYNLTRGSMGSVTVHSVAIDDAGEETGYDYQSKTFTKTVPFRIWHEEPLS